MSQTRAELELVLVSSYETYSALKNVYRKGEHVDALYGPMLYELRRQRFLHALLGSKGEPPGLLY